MEQEVKTVSRQLKTTKPEILSLFSAKANGDFSARQKLIEMNIGAVVYIANKFSSSINLPLEDLVSIGTVGLIKAVDKYIPELGRFEDFLFLCIKNEFLDYITDANTQKRKPKAKVVSLQDYCYKSSELTYEEVITNLAIDTEEVALKNLTREELEKLMGEKLTDIEIQVLCLHFGFFDNDCYTFQEIGDVIGTSRQRAHEIAKEALNKLKPYIKSSSSKEEINGKKL